MIAEKGEYIGRECRTRPPSQPERIAALAGQLRLLQRKRDASAESPEGEGPGNRSNSSALTNLTCRRQCWQQTVCLSIFFKDGFIHFGSRLLIALITAYVDYEPIKSLSKLES